MKLPIKNPAVQREAEKKKSGVVTGIHVSERAVKPVPLQENEAFYTKGITVGYTKNLGDFESLRISVSLTQSFPAETFHDAAVKALAEQVFADLTWLLKKSGVPLQFTDVPSAVQASFRR